MAVVAVLLLTTAIPSVLAQTSEDAEDPFDGVCANELGEAKCSLIAASRRGDTDGPVVVSESDGPPERIRVVLFGECFLAATPTGNASCTWVAASGTGHAVSWGFIAVSGTGDSTCSSPYAGGCYAAVSGLGDVYCRRGFQCVAVSGGGEAGGETILLAASGTEDASGATITFSGTGDAQPGSVVATSGTGNATCGIADYLCTAISAAGTAECQTSWVGLYCLSASGSEDATCYGSRIGCAAVSATGNASGESNPLRDPGGALAASGTGDADGDYVSSGTGDARGCGDPEDSWVRVKCIAVSGTGDSRADIAVSGTGHANGTIEVSGCEFVERTSGSTTACVDPEISDGQGGWPSSVGAEGSPLDPVETLLETSLPS